MSIDRKSSNGKGTQMHQSGGDLSTTVQTAKHLKSYITAMVDTQTNYLGAEGDITKHADTFAGLAGTQSKSLRGMSTLKPQSK